MENTIVVARFQEELTKTPDPVQFALTFPDRMAQAIEKAKTTEEANMLRALANMGSAYLRQTLPKVVQDRHERYLLMYPTESAFVDACAKAGTLWSLVPSEEKAKPGGDKVSEEYHSANSPNGQSVIDAGFRDARDATRCLRVGALDWQDLDIYKQERIQYEQHITISGAERVWHLLNPGKVKTPPLPDGTFDVVVIDPPWPVEKIERETAPNQVDLEHYATMPVEEIAKVVPPFAPDTHVWLWATQKYLPSAFELFDIWGVKYVCTFVWHKPGGFQPFGLPQYDTEFAIYGHVGAPEFTTTKDFKTGFHAPRGEHSEKPEEFYDMVRRVTDGRRLDMYSRRKIEGFDAWGLEAPL